MPVVLRPLLPSVETYAVPGESYRIVGKKPDTENPETTEPKEEAADTAASAE